MIIVGILLCIVSIPLVISLNSYDITKLKKRWLHFFMFFISILYIFLSFILKIEPFVFDELTETSDYLISLLIIFVFSPFLWVHLFYICKKIFKSIRVRKNSKVKTKEQFQYYRDDLNKLSPSTVVFTFNLENDIRKSVTATILKLKLAGFVQEKNGNIIKVDKNDSELLNSEKLVLSSLQTKKLDTKKYTESIEHETISMGFVRKNQGGKIVKIVKMIITIIIPIFLVKLSFAFDKYVFNNYRVYVYDQKRYVSVNGGEIGDIHFGYVENIDDYYHGVFDNYGKEEIFYDKALIRADKYDNKIVLTAAILQILDLIFLISSIIMIFVFAFLLIEQIIYFNKRYIRTTKGNDLLSKTYALKNYLKDFSIINKRNEEELILWEYYLIYAVALDINVQIKDKIIDKYYSSIGK